MSSTKAFVFDAYGTLFDVRSVLTRCEELFPGAGASLTTLWRTKQLEYTWLRSLMGRYEDFWQITRDALVYSCRALSLSATAEQIDGLMQSYLALVRLPTRPRLSMLLRPYRVPSCPTARRKCCGVSCEMPAGKASFSTS